MQQLSKENTIEETQLDHESRASLQFLRNRIGLGGQCRVLSSHDRIFHLCSVLMHGLKMVLVDWEEHCMMDMDNFCVFFVRKSNLTM